MRREGDHEPIGADEPGVQQDRDHYRELQKQRQRRVAKLLVALFITVVLIVFIIQNSARVDIHYVFFTAHNRLIWVMLACSILGGVVGYLIGRPGKQVRFHKKPEEDEQKKP